jgi:serine/threonine-protein kinase
MADTNSNDEAFADPLGPGAVFADKYRIVRKLGQGGMGAVYEAQHIRTMRRVAIKVMQGGFGDPSAMVRFQREAREAAQLSHPNIVDVLDMDQDPRTGALYIVQEFLQGQDLYAWYNSKGRLEPREAADLLVPVMAALVMVHERGIIHRDIKPENIFLVRDGGGVTPKLIDFGLALAVGDDPKARLTRTGALMGTVYYMSPEQARGVKDIDARADVWALGVTLYELLSGALPFEDETANMVLFKIMKGPPTPIVEKLPTIDPAVARVVHQAIEPDLNKRFPTMRAFLDAMLACPAMNGSSPLRERHARSIQHQPPPLPEPLPEQPPKDPGHAPTARPSIPQGSPPQRSTDDSWERVPSAAAPQRPRRLLGGVIVVVGVLALVVGAQRVLEWTRGVSSSTSPAALAPVPRAVNAPSARAPVPTAPPPEATITTTPPPMAAPPPSAPAVPTGDAAAATLPSAAGASAHDTRRERHRPPSPPSSAGDGLVPDEPSSHRQRHHRSAP